jgi:hypothetical protein
MLYTHCFICWASLTGPVFISVPRSVCLVLKMVLTLKRLPMRLSFSEIRLTYGIMNVTNVLSASPLLHYGVSELLCVFMKYQIVSYVLNFLVETFLIPPCNWSNYERLQFSRDVGGWILNMDNGLYNSFLSRNIKIRIYKTIILPVVLYACGTWSLILREEHRLRVFENRCWGEYLDQREMKWQVRENYIMRSFITCTLLQV